MVQNDENMLPKGWAQTTLGEIADTTRKRRKPQEYPLFPFIGMQHVEAHTMRLLDTVPSSEMKSTAEHFESGDVLYGRLRPYLNKVYSPDFEGLCSAEFIVFRRVPWLNRRFLQYFLNSWDFVAFTSLLDEGDRPRVSFDQLAPRPFLLPPLPEQQRIVAEIETQFTRLEAGVAALKRAQVNLRRYKASVLKAACEGRLVPTEAELARAEGRDYEPADVLLERILAERRARWEAENPGKKYKQPKPPDTSDLPDLPEGWVWAAVAQVGEVRLGRQRSPRYHHGPHMRPYLRAANATWDGVGLSDIMEMDFPPQVFETYRLQKGDVLLSEASGSPDEVGKPFVWNEEIPDCCFQNTLIRVRLDGLPSSFVYVHFLKDARTGRFAQLSRGVGIHHLGSTRLAVFPITIPPLDEQNRIVAEVERRLSVVGELEKQVEMALRRAKRLRQAILKHAFEGKLVPQDPNDEPASVLLARIKAERSGQGKKTKVKEGKPEQLKLANV